MTTNELIQLSHIYNGFLAIKTSGQDTINMGKCLESFQAFLMEASKQEEEKQVDNKEE